MSNTLTPTEQQAVKDAATQYSERSNTNTGQYGSLLENMKQWSENDFKAGVSFALSTLFEPRCVAFAEWVGQGYFHIEDDKWADAEKDSLRYTTSELYSIYNEQLNKQQDGNEKI